MILGIPAFIVYIGSAFAIIIAGIFFFLGIFSREKNTSVQTAENALKFVNEAFQKKIEYLEKQVAEQTAQLVEQDKRLAAIESENRLLREVLQGRDQMAQEFQQKGLEVIHTTVPEILVLTKATNDNVNKLCRSLDSLVRAMNTKTTVTTMTQPIV